jgi:hypothetical protein
MGLSIAARPSARNIASLLVGGLKRRNLRRLKRGMGMPYIDAAAMTRG